MVVLRITVFPLLAKKTGGVVNDPPSGRMLKSLSKGIIVSSLLLLNHSLTNLKDSTQIQFPESDTCTSHPSTTATPKAYISPWQKSVYRVSLACVNLFDLKPFPIDFCRGSHGET